MAALSYDAALAVVYTVYECLHTPCTLVMTFEETQFPIWMILSFFFKASDSLNELLSLA